MSLQVNRLSKRVGDKWILRDVSFEAERGKILGLFGVSGSGKTVILRAIAGIDKSAGGTVLFDSKNVTDLSSDARNFHLSRPAKNSIFTKIMKSARSALLSGGERAVAVFDEALQSRCSLLLLDDSFRPMDSFMKDESFAKLRRIAEGQNIAVVFATNNYEDVLALCDSVAILNGGEIGQTGMPQGVYSEPNSFAVARITGRNNLFEARRLTSSKSENPLFQTLAGEHRLGVEKMKLSSLGALNQTVWLGIRPEHISIAFEASFPEDNLLKAKVTGVHMLGPTTLVELNSGGLILEALVLRLVGLNIGDECMLGIPPNRIQVFRN